MNYDPPPPPPVQIAVSRLIPVHCPYCRVELNIRGDVAGTVIDCPHCRGRFQAPLPGADHSYIAGSGLNPGIKIAVLISAVGNIAVGLIWICTLCGVVIGVPQIVLAVFEIIFFAQNDKLQRQQALDRAWMLGILEIVSGLFNLISLVCGILVLVFTSNEKGKGPSVSAIH